MTVFKGGAAIKAFLEEFGACPRISLGVDDQQTGRPQLEFQKTDTDGNYPAIVSATEWLSGSWPDRHSFRRLCVAENSDHSACAPIRL